MTMDRANYITSTRFSVSKNDELARLATIDITSHLFSPNIRRNILGNENFGPDQFSNQLCVICKERYRDCNGHFGVFSNVLLYKTLFVPMILKVLNQVCSQCTHLRAKNDKVCRVCRTPKVKYVLFKYSKQYKSNKKVDPITIARVTGGNDEPLTQKQVFDILVNLSSETIESFGISSITSGSDLMWRAFPILSKRYRKDNKVGDKVVKNHIESLYQHMMRLIGNLLNNTDNIEKYSKIQDELQVTEMQLVDGDKYRRSDGTAFSTILPKLMKKEGMIQNDLICKRTDNSLRTVIIPAYEMISINEVGIPRLFARELVVHEQVTVFNIHRLTEMLLNKDYPRIKYRREMINGESVERSAVSIDKLAIGDVIARDMINGDKIIINRQPTLSKHSMMCFKAHIIEGKAIALNIATCVAYNADFDGDNMNGFNPKNEKSALECFLKMCVSSNVFSGAFSGVLIAPMQDIVTALNALTKHYCFLSEYQKNFVLRNIETSKLPREAYREGDLPMFSGKSIFSSILPRRFNFTSRDDAGNVRIKVVDGVLLEGEIDKYSVMKQQKGLINAIYEIYGEVEVLRFIDNLQILGSNFLKIYGLTTGLQDFWFGEDHMRRVRAAKTIKYRNLYKNINRYSRITPVVDKVLTKEIESVQNASDIVSEIYKTEFHHFHNIVSCGAKGNGSEVNKMCYTVGQITIGKNRYSDKNQFVADFDNSSRYGLGIVENSYIEGLNLAEVQMVNQNAMNSTASTQLTTAQPGYINTRINELVRDFIFVTDFTIRNPVGEVLIQHYFNSFESEKETAYVINVKLETLLIDEAESATFGLPEPARAKYNDYLTRVHAWMHRANERLSRYEVIKNVTVFLPFDFEVLLENTELPAGEPCRDLGFLIRKIDQILASYNTSPFKQNDNVNKLPMAYALHYYLHPKRISVPKQTYEELCRVIVDKIIFAQVEPGNQLLLKSGTSYNSVVTQEILNSLHSIKSGNPQKYLNDNFNVSKTSKEEITSYIEDSHVMYEKLIFKSLVKTTTCRYGDDPNRRVYKLLYAEGSDPKHGLMFTFRLGAAQLIENKLLLPFVFVGIINAVDNIIQTDTTINKQITYLHVSCSAVGEYPAISVLIGGNIQNATLFINYFIKVVKEINIRDTNITSIFIEERDFKYKKCAIEGITLREAMKLKFIKRNCVLTSNLYAVFEMFGVLGYFAASLINLFNIGKDKNVNPKHAASISHVICLNNSLVPLTRQGFDKISVGRWPTIAFENQSNNLVKAALKGSVDHGQSINSQLLFGHKLKIGSNHATVHFDISKFKQFTNYRIQEPKENKLYNILKSTMEETTD